MRLFFQCGDPRLLEVGAYWLAPAILAQSYENVDAGKPLEERIAARQFFLIPGTLLPARWDTYQNIELYLP